MAEADELITWLGFKFKPDAKRNIESAQKSIDMIKEGVRKIGTFFLGASGAIGYFTNDVMKGAQQMTDLSRKMGVSTDVLQQWKYVAESSGQSFEGLIGDLEQFRKVGIDAVSLSGKLAGMSSKIALQYKDRFGISDDMFNVLRQGPAQIKKLMAEAYVIPSDSIEQTAKFNKQLNAAKNTLIAMKNEIFMAVSPTLVDLTQKFKDWMSVNKEWIKSKLVDIIKGVALGFQRFVEIAGKAFGYLVDIAKAMGLIGENAPQVESVAKVVTGVLLLWAGGKVAAGLTTVFTIFKGIYGLFASIASIKVGATITAWMTGIKAVGATVMKVLGPLYAILTSAWELFQGFKNGFSNRFDEIKENFSFWDLLNPAKLAVLGGGVIGDKVGDWIYRAINGDPLHPTLPAGMGVQGTTTNNTNSGNTINIQMPFDQATQFVRDTTGGSVNINMMTLAPGAFGGNVQ